MTLAETISAVPELYEQGDESTARLLLASGYLDQPQALTVEDVEAALRRDPDLADRWLERGHDQRLSGGWGIECDHGQYKVQSYAGGRALVEKKKLHAVAEFIVRYVAFMGDVLSRHRARGFRRTQSHMERSAKIPRNPNWWAASPGLLSVRRVVSGMSDHNSDKSAPVPMEMPMSQGKDGKVPDKVVPVPADDPAVATLADDLHANA